MNMSNTEGSMAMTPWLHFTEGENLFFRTWHPSSQGAVAGACIALAALAILERWVSGMRGSLDAYWKQQTSALMAGRANRSKSAVAAAAIVKNDEKIGEHGHDPSEVTTGRDTERPWPPLNRTHRRVAPPFVAAYDLSRGAVFALQALLAYLLMLAVMTFQAAYIVAIVVGLGLGETMFGRMGSTHLH